MDQIISSRTGRLGQRLFRHRYLLLMALPGVIYFVVFHYIPLWGILVAFKDFKPYLGFSHSDWIGLQHFHRLVADPTFWRALANSLIINFYNLLFYFPAPIILALLLNEVRNKLFKRTVQTAVYLPHFLSWVIIYGLTVLLFSSQGLINVQLRKLDLEPIPILTEPVYFRPTVVIQQIWRDAGWGAIVILAALTGISPELYEAASIDGANRWQQLRYVTLPGIKSVLVILLILRMSGMLRVGFEQIYIMQNPLNYQVSEVLETYSFRTGILNGNLGYAAAVGLFQSVVALLLVVSVNWLANRMGEEGIW